MKRNPILKAVLKEEGEDHRSSEMELLRYLLLLFLLSRCCHHSYVLLSWFSIPLFRLVLAKFI